MGNSKNYNNQSGLWELIKNFIFIEYLAMLAQSWEIVNYFVAEIFWRHLTIWMTILLSHVQSTTLITDVREHKLDKKSWVQYHHQLCTISLLSIGRINLQQFSEFFQKFLSNSNPFWTLFRGGILESPPSCQVGLKLMRVNWY